MTAINLKRWVTASLFAALCTAIAVAQAKVPPCSLCAEWNKTQTPFRIFGNTYYVGPHGLSSVLITSQAGHVLIDGGLPESVPQIVNNIRVLGFRVEDVKLILSSHVHFDHAGGIAELQRLSAARVMASKWSAAVMKEGGVGVGDPQFGILAGIAPIKNVYELRDGETFHVGDILMTAHSTPGHTPGGTSWTWKSCTGTVCRNMVFADSVTPVAASGFKFTKSTDYPEAIADFEKTFVFLETVPCDILITTHPEASGLWDRVEEQSGKVTFSPAMDSSACRRLAGQGREQLRQRLMQENKP